jgi:hypothetical protein
MVVASLLSSRFLWMVAESVADPGAALRERHLSPAGVPSETAYAQSEGILPLPRSESFHWQVIFKLTYRSADVSRLRESAPIHTDCYFVRTRKFVAARRVLPVWDGRAYQATDRLQVAAYTAAGEQPFGHIDERLRVVRTAKTNDSNQMPDLDGVHYNPFTGQLWRGQSGGQIEEQQRLYLPVTLIDRRGAPIQAEFKIVQTNSHWSHAAAKQT